jgi:hypothetical protein
VNHEFSAILTQTEVELKAQIYFILRKRNSYLSYNYTPTDSKVCKGSLRHFINKAKSCTYENIKLYGAFLAGFRSNT